MRIEGNDRAKPKVRVAIHNALHFRLKTTIGGLHIEVNNIIGKSVDFYDSSIFKRG
ncbi:MAG: hypothetical protein ACJAYB_002587 [Psychromonas sp.]|jgi:hypothetical protein